MPSAPTPAIPQTASPFARALEEYINSRPKKSKTPQFIRDIQQQIQNGVSIDGNAVNTAIVQVEKNSTDRAATQRMRKVLKPIVSVLATYSGVVDTMCNADPMPTALIWGCLKATIQCSTRFLDLYDKIGDQLTDLRAHLEVLTMYDELFGDSTTMQELLQASYIDIIRFWHRVEKECKRCIANRMSRALASFSTDKLDRIIASIDRNAQRISLLVPAVQGRLERGEREDAAEERRLAGIARDEQKLLLELHVEELKIRNEERKRARKASMDLWLLGGAAQVNESNHRHQEQNTRSRNPETCTWLLNEASFSDWLQPTGSSPVLWVKAAPGVGKSVLTAFAIEEAQRTSPDSSATCFQYYTFDDEFSYLQVFRALAEQLSNQLWEQTGDMPEDIVAITQKTATSSKADDIKSVLRQFIQRMSTTYVFLDGLDEECDNGSRWHQAKQVLDFLIGLAVYEKLPVRLWCSSQPRTCVDGVLQLYPTLQITPDLNNKDIERYLKNQIPELDNLELDEGYKNLVLSDLRTRADGCFLWASLMLNSITNAASLQAIQEHINEGLPKDYENYYLRKLNSIGPSDRRLVSILLACIVYAKRPLRLDELCEATAAVEAKSGQNIDRSRKLFRRKVTTFCQPLVRVQDTETPHGTVTTCTLTHSTVRNFLLKQAQEAGAKDDRETLHIAPDTIADICLKYLMQPRFKTLLKKEGNLFKDELDEDIDNHHLLPYAAKYWDKHLDVAAQWKSFCEPVKDFVTSAQFFTCLQVQSLLVGGQFQFWWNSKDIAAGPHIKRVFPAWLGAQCDQTLENDYRLFVSDWGFLLDEIINLNAPYSGELDRCFFGSLGFDNFMHAGPSRYASYQIRDDEASSDSLPARYFDAIDATGSEMAVLALYDIKKDTLRLEFDCQQWDLTGNTPTLRISQKLSAGFIDTLWLLYDLPPTTNSFGKPPVVAWSSDLALLRIGSQIYTKDSNDMYQLALNVDTHAMFIDEFASRHHQIAITTRREFPYAEKAKRDAQVMDHPPEVHGQAVIIQIANGVLSNGTSTNPTTTEGTDETGTLETSKSSNTSVDSDTESKSEVIDDIRIEDASKFKRVSRREAILAEELEEDDPLLNSDSDASGNTAEEEWSDGSSDMLSDEVEDEDQWNDWGNDRLTIEALELEVEDSFPSSPASEASAANAEVPDFDDLESLASQNEDLNIDEVWTAGEGDEIKISGFMFKRGDLGIDSDSSSSRETSSVESNYSLSNYSDDGSDDDNSDFDVDTAKHLDTLIFGKGSREGKQRISLQVYDVNLPHGSPTFHFTRYVQRGIFDSPPVFHPSKPLLVWPLGDAEILFADYKANSFFTRLLCCSRFKSCHIFVKAHFSSSGEYLHFASLEAQTKESKEKDEKGSLILTLQVSTHRLSVRKTTRSPPRLIYRTTIDLGTAPTLNISSSPYTLHWTDETLYLTTRAQTLHVMRIPLFPDAQTGKSSVCYIQKEVYLPRTADSRTLHFFPRPPPSSRAPSTRSKTSGQLQSAAAAAAQNTMAKIIIGSHSAIPSQGLLVPRYQVAPPIGVLLHEERDLGGWKCKAIIVSQEEEGEEGRAKQRLNNAGGRLQGKFETFDRTEDCDIVPFLY
ncbi:Nn.00g044260.m01.CDS01 [Neocucurbitaria sp. VM-36]